MNQLYGTLATTFLCMSCQWLPLTLKPIWAGCAETTKDGSDFTLKERWKHFAVSSLLELEGVCRYEFIYMDILGERENSVSY